MKTLSRCTVVFLCIAALSGSATLRADDSTAYRMEVAGRIATLRLPAEWQQLPSDLGFVYFADAGANKKITFYVRPLQQHVSPLHRSEGALTRLRRLHREISRQGISHLQSISQGPRLAITQDHASWMYRVVRPEGDDGRVREIRYWTIVVRQGQFDYYLELRWEPGSGHFGNEQLSLKDEFDRTFGPICNTLRFESQRRTIPVSVRVQR